MSRFKFLLFILLIGIVLASAAAMKFMSFIAPADSNPSEKIIVEVPPGSSFTSALQNMEAKGVIKDAWLLKLMLKTFWRGKTLKVGEYEMYYHMPPAEALQILSSGKSIEYHFTIPEGTNIFEVAQILERAKFGTKQEILNKLRDKSTAQKALEDKEALSFEGYLFPETYSYTKYSTFDSVLSQMVNLFKKNFAEVSKGTSTLLTPHQIVTLASIIEKETGAPEERPLISSVFHNRLAKGMRLQTDPTILYGMALELGEMPINIRRQDILRPTPYNTYSIYGLPPGPIANPGREALAAAFAPAQSNYIFFVSRNDGTHVFTSALDDHNKAVTDFQKNVKARENKSWRDLKKKK